jgi:2-phosphosulfolactate phosphatase
VHVLGAATRGEFRPEDLMCCARIGAALVGSGFAVADKVTAAIIARWSRAPVTAFLVSRSVAYLQATNQLDDLDFILDHVDDDLETVATLRAGELVCAADALACCG